MKTRYFTDKTIREKSLEILRASRKNDTVSTIRYEPEQSALLILDMQKFFLDERSHAFIPGAAPIVPNIKKLADAYNEMKAPVIMTRHLNNGENAGLMSEWWKDIITENDELSNIIPELDIQGAVVIKKTQYDGFYRTSLEEILKERGVSQLVITGVMTHLCCETTVRSAFVRGFAVFFPADCTATYNEEFHRASFLNLSHGFAVPVVTGELIEEIKKVKV